MPVFLSYASEDAVPVRRLADALRGAGIEAWFDQDELRGGDAWDTAIRQRIRDCTLFVPIVSRTTEARAEGYFRLEWKLALDRWQMMAGDRPFLLPVAIDAVGPQQARVPDGLRQVQWLRVTDPPDVARLVERVQGLLAALDDRAESAPPAASAPGRTAAPAVAHNLPSATTSFVGREAEMQQLTERLSQHRLVTLVGPGGAGKTRLAIESARSIVRGCPGGAWLVELAAMQEPGLVSQAIAAACGVSEEPGTPLLRSVVRVLATRGPTLLILDNCEHVVGACASAAGALLAGCPDVRLVATSREALRVEGEATLQVAPLGVPEGERAWAPEALGANAAVRLFVDRVRAWKPQFRLDAGNAEAVRQICVRLDGIPLALELAAARVRAMPLEQVAQRLDQSFRLLTGGSRSALPRQQTLRALVDWSYDLLEPAERLLLPRLSVFADGWSLEAAEQVCADEALPEEEVVERLASLVDKSLVLLDESVDPPRYRLLQTIRQYAAERLAQSEDTEAWRLRHAKWFQQAIHAVADQEDPRVWTPPIRADEQNIRAALQCLAERDAAAALVLAVDVSAYWFSLGQIEEGERTLSLVLQRETPDAMRGLRARALRTLAEFRKYQGRYAEARAGYEASLSLAREAGEPRRVLTSMRALALLSGEEGHHERARAEGEQCLAYFREIGDEGLAPFTYNLLGILAHLRRDHEGARHWHGECLAIARRTGNAGGLASTLNNLGDLAADCGDFETARAQCAESLRLRVGLGHRMGVEGSFIGLAKAALGFGDALRSARLLAFGLRLRAEVQRTPSAQQRAEDEELIARVRNAAPGAPAFDAAWSEGSGWSFETAVAEALRDVPAP